ncbi:flagellar export chaperone FlgN [Adhaeretor mobilis]|uniref:FlgN protein n=1 Tax=Adhaeretor mobilis TaxID=1930276 RepID=A0A517MTV8_9BACT|nr:flagellar export chaperone FlgN [Adhaeretor mobilis]QDS98320.1 FlgN protein [Adhaeretor mobilis]
MTESDNATPPAETTWDTAVAGLIERLSTAQTGLLDLLASKREMLQRQDHEALASLAPEEAALGVELAACHQAREALLTRAAGEGLTGKTLAEASQSLPSEASAALVEPLAAAKKRSQLIRHECLAQWVVVQRTVLHLSQMLEIVATGGRSKPTYDNGSTLAKGVPQANSGSLMDRAV